MSEVAKGTPPPVPAEQALADALLVLKAIEVEYRTTHRGSWLEAAATISDPVVLAAFARLRERGDL